MVKPKGGRGKRSEHGSVMIRIPTPLKNRVIELKEMFYRDELQAYDESLANNERLANEYLKLVSSSDSNGETTQSN